jgi:6-phosphofructokinase 1
VLPEVEFDLDGLVQLLVEDKRNNPSSYSFVIASEGAVWKGQKVAEFGESDAYGHKKKADIGHALAEEIKKRTGEDTMSSDLTYDLRSGEADSLDHLVAITFANIAMDLVRDGVSGRMTAIQDGKYTHAPLPDPKAGPRKVDIERLYNRERFRPNYSGKLNSPMFLSAERA